MSDHAPRYDWVPVGEPGRPAYWRCHLGDGVVGEVSAGRRNDNVVTWEAQIVDPREQSERQYKVLGEFPSWRAAQRAVEARQADDQPLVNL